MPTRSPRRAERHRAERQRAERHRARPASADEGAAGTVLAWLVCGGVLTALVGAFVLVTDLGPHRLALELRAEHLTARVTDASYDGNGKGPDTVHVTFVAGGRTVTTRALGAQHPVALGGHPPATVAYLPHDPRRAMLSTDVTHYADHAIRTDVAITVTGAVVAGLSRAGLVLLRTTGPRRRRVSRRS